LDVVPLDVCGIVFRRPYMYMRDSIFMHISNHYFLIKDGKSFIINTHTKEKKNSLVNVNQAKKLINSRKKYVLLFLRENQSDDELIRVKESLVGCTKEKKTLVGGVSTGIQRSVLQ
jgi:hypothetical protein